MTEQAWHKICDEISQEVFKLKNVAIMTKRLPIECHTNPLHDKTTIYEAMWYLSMPRQNARQDYILHVEIKDIVYADIPWTKMQITVTQGVCAKLTETEKKSDDTNDIIATIRQFVPQAIDTITSHNEQHKQEVPKQCVYDRNKKAKVYRTKKPTQQNVALISQDK